MSSLVVVLDACVLFPASLRDTLLRAAYENLYRVQLTDDILDEVERNLVKTAHLSEYKAQKHMEVIREEFPDAFITHHRPLIAVMPNNEKDRHVLAAAVASRAQIIVTQNLKDFLQDYLAPFEVTAQPPDSFLITLFHNYPDEMIRIMKEQAKDLHNPPMTVGEVLNSLSLHAPKFTNMLRLALLK